MAQVHGPPFVWYLPVAHPRFARAIAKRKIAAWSLRHLEEEKVAVEKDQSFRLQRIKEIESSSIFVHRIANSTGYLLDLRIYMVAEPVALQAP